MCHIATDSQGPPAVDRPCMGSEAHFSDISRNSMARGQAMWGRHLIWRDLDFFRIMR
jgi:hypothetical protein